jgi:Cof subfamily protein (haloacid dehalogenase superfamily)
MKSIKLCVFDIDGTLLSVGSDVIEASAVSAIQALKQRGVKIAVATGRNYPFIKPMVREVLEADYYVSINGHCLQDKHAQVIKEYPLDSNTMLDLLALAQEHHLPIAYKAAHEMRVLFDYDNFVEQYSEGFDVKHLLPDHTHRPIESMQESPPLGIFMVAEAPMVELIRSRYDDLQVIPNYGRRVDVFGKHMNKAVGIEPLLDILGIDWSNVMAFGDADNDLEMLEAAGVAIAMGNAKAHVQAAADYVSAAVDQGGIQQALKHYKLID